MKFETNNHKYSDKKVLFFIGIFLIFVWLLNLLSPLIFKTGRYISDYSDIFAYYERANWVVTNEAPLSEYPQIPTYLFGLNKFIAEFFNVSVRFAIFYSITTLEMIVAQFFVIKILIESFPSEQKYQYLLMLLPPTLYFVVNRFDILPALLCIIALKLAKDRRFIFSSIILALATFTKWYPILLLPGFFAYASSQENKLQWKMIIFFLITSLFTIMPTYFLGGLEAVIFPYKFHLSRGMEFVALPLLINNILSNFDKIAISQQNIFSFFFILQITSPLLILLLRINTRQKLVNYCVIVISFFILFSRVNSPQFFIWLMPFLIISIKTKTDIWIIILYNILSYLFFPVVFDFFGGSSIQLQILGISIYLLLILIISRSFMGMDSIFKPKSFDRFVE